MYTLNEMLELGMLVAHDDELGLYVTANGSYLNLWATRIRGPVTLYENIDCRSFGDAPPDGLLQWSGLKLMKEAQEFIRDVIKQGQDES
jgi:hypothetical protein